MDLVPEGSDARDLYHEAFVGAGSSTFTEFHDRPRVPGLLSTNHSPPSWDQSRRQLQRERRSGGHCPCAQPAVARQDAIVQLRASLLQPCCVLVAPLRPVRLHVLFGVLAHLRVPPQEDSAKSGHCLVTQAVAAQLRLLPRAVAPLCGLVGPPRLAATAPGRPRPRLSCHW